MNKEKANTIIKKAQKLIELLNIAVREVGETLDDENLRASEELFNAWDCGIELRILINKRNNKDEKNK